jgi:hypothetical protein
VRKINNSIAVFIRQNTFLDFYIAACHTIVRQAEKLDTHLVGTRFLTTLSTVLPMQLVEGAGMLSPVLMQSILQNRHEPLRVFQKLTGSPLSAANLCASFRNRVVDGVTLNDSFYESVMDSLLESRGAIISPP